MLLSAFKEQIVSPITAQSFTAQAGPLFATPLGTYPGVAYPANQWLIRQWIYITAMHSPTSNAFRTNLPGLSIFWTNGDLYFGEDNTNFFTKVVSGGLPLSTWVYMAMGMYEIGSSFAVVQLRGENPYQLTLANSPALTTDTVYVGSNDVTSFTVSD